MNRLMALLVSRMRPNMIFAPIRELSELGAIPVLYRVIARNVYAHANWPGRSECTRIAVDILNIMSLSYELAEAIVTADVYCYPDGRLTFAEHNGSQHSLRGRRNAEQDNDDDDDDADETNGPRLTLRAQSPHSNQLIDLIFGQMSGRHRGTESNRGHPVAPAPTIPPDNTGRTINPQNQSLGGSATRRSGRRSIQTGGQLNLDTEDPTSDERVNGLL